MRQKEALMMIFPHLAVGGAIGEELQNPIAIFFIGFLSHFIFDLVPHYHPQGLESGEKLNKRVVLITIGEGLVSLVTLGLIYFLKPNPLIIWGAFSAILPDIIEVLHFLPLLEKVLEPYHQFKTKVHWWVKSKWGILPQWIIAFIATFLILK